MAAVNASEPAQPSLNTAYNTEGNPASKEPAEQQYAQQQNKDDAPQTYVQPKPSLRHSQN
jgi:hypothetical protein